MPPIKRKPRSWTKEERHKFNLRRRRNKYAKDHNHHYADRFFSRKRIFYGIQKKGTNLLLMWGDTYQTIPSLQEIGHKHNDYFNSDVFGYLKGMDCEIVEVEIIVRKVKRIRMPRWKQLAQEDRDPAIYLDDGWRRIKKD